jgi:hypothetical protein
MIAKLIPRKHGHGSFKDSVNYNLGLSGNDTDKVEYVNTVNIFEPLVAISEMEAIASENTRSADPVFNCILSWRESEIPSKGQADGAVEIVLKELGLEGCQVHYALHRNTENLHLHICVNRIDPETYKARDPAHGWTKKALEKAARKIELAQGWEVEQSGRYVVTEGGEIQEKPRVNGDLKLSQTARDIEAHTAAKSAERIGQETAAPVIREAQTWEELHEKLAGAGIAFEKKGSGAILHIGETIVKASQAGRDISLSKLEKRLGAYRERDSSVLICEQAPKAIERVEMTPKVKGSWKRYQEAKAEYLNAKKNAFADLQKRHKTERKTLSENRRLALSTLFSVSWKGRGAELNQRRSVIAARQAVETLNLRERQKEEREALKLQFPRQFPSFKAWLAQDANNEVSALYRYPGQLVIFAADVEEKNIRAEKHDLRDYSPVSIGGGGSVMYCRNGASVADFIDYGKKIVLGRKIDESAIIAAMQLASQKWGAVQLNGSDEYKRLCVRLAVEHGFRIVNPELKPEIEALQKQKVTRPESERNTGWGR